MKNVLTRIFFIHVLSLVLICQHGFSQKKDEKKAVNGYAKASYSLASSGQFMRDWLIAGPIAVKGVGTSIPDDATQSKFFSQDDFTSLPVNPKKPFSPIQKDGATFSWTPYTAVESKIDFEGFFKNKDFVQAYAVAEIKSDADQKVLFAFGSDDGIKVILNGKVIHNNWVPRAITPDEDIVPATLVKGSNQLIVKVQDMQGDWGFTARIMDDQAKINHLARSASAGNLDEITNLIEAGANVNGTAESGLTPLNASKMHGRSESTKLLLSKGAKESTFPDANLLVDNEYASLEGKKAAGISVLVARDGKVLYEKGFGYADIEKNAVITPETKFRIGSITKQFIGVSILKLQEDGKLSVHDKLSKYIPDFTKGDEVTIHHLLTHTSGIHSYTNKGDFIVRVTSPISEDDLVELIKKEPYDFEPGERFLYNNSAFFLLGHIIRKVTGKSWGEYLDQQFFKPIGMSNTGVYDNTVPLTLEAKGYKKENGEYKADINWDMTWAGGAGALYSTVRDLYLWNEALFNGKVLKPESLNAGLTPVILNNGKTPMEGNYGYGWFLGTYRGQEVVEHGGGLHGFSTRLSRFPQEKLTVVMLTNVIPTEVTLNPNEIADFYIWDKLAPQASFSLNTSVAENVKIYEGKYDFVNGSVLTITSEHNNLFAHVSGQAKYPIFPAAPGEYFWKVVEARIKFLKNEKGEVNQAEFSQGGNQLTISRLKDLAIVKIDPALLEYYVGVYDLGDDGQVTVTKENGKLYAQSKTTPRYEIKPLSDTEFALEELNARLTFVREGTQKANKFILNMAGQNRDVPRID
jgi:CubicO group peptidase (beta-lactamase class C family)